MSSPSASGHRPATAPHRQPLRPARLRLARRARWRASPRPRRQRSRQTRRHDRQPGGHFGDERGALRHGGSRPSLHYVSTSVGNGLTTTIVGDVNQTSGAQTISSPTKGSKATMDIELVGHEAYFRGAAGGDRGAHRPDSPPVGSRCWPMGLGRAVGQGYYESTAAALTVASVMSRARSLATDSWRFTTSSAAGARWRDLRCLDRRRDHCEGARDRRSRGDARRYVAPRPLQRRGPAKCEDPPIQRRPRREQVGRGRAGGPSRLSRCPSPRSSRARQRRPNRSWSEPRLLSAAHRRLCPHRRDRRGVQLPADIPSPAPRGSHVLRRRARRTPLSTSVRSPTAAASRCSSPFSWRSSSPTTSRTCTAIFQGSSEPLGVVLGAAVILACRAARRRP